MVFTISVISLNATGPEDLVYITEDYAPSNYLENGELKGVAVDLLRALWNKMGVENQAIEVYPWARGYQMVLNRADTVLFAMTRNKDREDFFKWVGPIYRGRTSIITLSDNYDGIESLSGIMSGKLGALRDDLGYHLLIKEGFNPELIWEGNSVEQLVKMLESRRIDYISIYEDSMREYASSTERELQDFKTVRVLSENVMYYAFNKDTDDSLIKRFQIALDQIDDQRRSIVESYMGIP